MVWLGLLGLNVPVLVVLTIFEQNVQRIVGKLAHDAKFRVAVCWRQAILCVWPNMSLNCHAQMFLLTVCFEDKSQF